MIETTEHGGYPVLEHLRLIVGGPVVWAPAVDGAVVLSQRGDDFELVVGQDLSIGYTDHDADSVGLYLEESITFRAAGPRGGGRAGVRRRAPEAARPPPDDRGTLSSALTARGVSPTTSSSVRPSRPGDVGPARAGRERPSAHARRPRRRSSS